MILSIPGQTEVAAFGGYGHHGKGQPVVRHQSAIGLIAAHIRLAAARFVSQVFDSRQNGLRLPFAK